MSSALVTDSAYRGCAAKFSQPLSHKDKEEAQSLVDKINGVNCKQGNLSEIIYRSGDGERDILRQVFRWDLKPYDEVFQHGVQAHRGHFSSDSTFYNLQSYYMHGRGRPLDSRKTSTFAFISTTVSNSWFPPVPCHHGADFKSVEIYRYEIYAPGGIWTSLSVGDKDDKKFKRLDEVAFVCGIAPQYFRSAQLFRLAGYPDGTTVIERVDNMLQINGNFNPQSHPLRLLNIENPVSDYLGGEAPLVQRIRHQPRNSNPNIIDWYAQDVSNRDIYMTSALRSSKLNEAYYILQNWCTQLNYDPGSTHDFIVKGPIFLSKMFKSLEYTPFGEHGIDGAIQSHDDDEAIIFYANLCALINYSPNENNDKIIKGPMSIAKMFPFFKGTVFESGIDSACESKSGDEYEAFVFKGNLCAHINYGLNPKLIGLGQISQMIPLLKGTVFEGVGVDAAYGSHAKDEVAYFFKFNNYGQINVDVDDGKEYLAGVWVMGANAPVIHSFVPQKNRGLDMREDATALPNSNDYAHDDL